MVPTLSAHHLSRGTLKIPCNKEYFAHQIGLTDVPVKTIPAFYDYSKQTRLYVIKKVSRSNKHQLPNTRII